MSERRRWNGGLAVFGYGSLVSSASLAEVLARPVGRCTPARLDGWRRRWSLRRHNLTSEKTFELRDGRLPTWILSLNIERSSAGESGPNGLLFSVTERELERLDAREHRYDRIDVTEDLVADELPTEAAHVFSYTAKPTHHAASAPDDAVVLRTYFETVETAFAELGTAELLTYRETTEPPAVAVVDGRLIADSIPPGNPRRW